MQWNTLEFVCKVHAVKFSQFLFFPLFFCSRSRNVYGFEFVLNSVQQTHTYSAHCSTRWRGGGMLGYTIHISIDIVEKYSNATEKTIK